MLNGPVDEPAAETALAARLAWLRERRRPVTQDVTAKVRDAVIVASSSRSGSSMLAEMLHRARSLVHLRAELNPFLRLAKLAYPHTDSDRLDADSYRALPASERRVLDEELSFDLGQPSDRVDDVRFVLDAAWRFTIQWPALNFDVADWVATAHAVLAEQRRRHGFHPGRFPDVARFYKGVFDALDERGVTVRRGYYDLRKAAGGGADAGAVRGAPGELLIEEPPFVLSDGWRYADEQDLATKPVVIKTPSNSYRIDFLRALFSNARIRVLHLTRNPAASINGLFDGWLHHGFHAHRMAKPLNMRGYGLTRPEDRWWWKFDLPPGWQAYTDAPLLDVCAMQWRASHQEILDQMSRGQLPYLHIHFEDLVRSPASRALALTRIAQWLDIPFDESLRRISREGLTYPVAATVRPVPGRWRQRLDMIRDVIGGPEMTLAKELGYADEADWI